MYDIHNLHPTFERNLLPVKEADLGHDFWENLLGTISGRIFCHDLRNLIK